ncbi:MAG TPA: hypothetical protein VK447_09875 [Myxococcaceae bacterium]|nr:hypothetical protein [Myxococcaceae bacterium]
MSYGLGRLQSLSAVLSRLLEARGYLEGQPADLEQLVGEVDALAAKVKQRRDAALVSLLVDDLGKVTNLAQTSEHASCSSSSPRRNGSGCSRSR